VTKAVGGLGSLGGAVGRMGRGWPGGPPSGQSFRDDHHHAPCFPTSRGMGSLHSLGSVLGTPAWLRLVALALL